jgi:hypothetical protein
MVKPAIRRKSIGTKVSEEEYARLEALAGGRAMSEWVREVLLRELDGRQARPADPCEWATAHVRSAVLLAGRRHETFEQDHSYSPSGPDGEWEIESG